MKFTPKTLKEIEEQGLLPAGFYDYEVVEASEKTSPAGNLMIAIKLKVKDSMGHERFVFDNLMEAFSEKLYSFAHTNGYHDEYGQGELTPGMCIGVRGRAEIVKSPSRIDKNGKEWRARNEVKIYLPKSEEKTIEGDIPW